MIEIFVDAPMELQVLILFGVVMVVKELWTKWLFNILFNDFNNGIINMTVGYIRNVVRYDSNSNWRNYNFYYYK